MNRYTRFLLCLTVAVVAKCEDKISLDVGSNNLGDLFKTVLGGGSSEISGNPLAGLSKVLGGGPSGKLPSIDGLNDLLSKGNLLGPLQEILGGNGLSSGPLESNFGSVLETLRGKNPDKVIGENCTRSSECAAPFSICLDDMCQCMEGFQPEETNATCLPSGTPKCSFGEPLQKEGAIQACTRSRKGSGCNGPECLIKGLPIFTTLNTGLNVANERFEDSCPDGSYCSIYRGRSLSGSKFMGHCCPKPNPACPLGKPLTNATCSIKQPCPSTHYCHRVLESGLADPLISVCCPVACKARDTIYKEGRCLPLVRLGGSCEASEQCPANSDCDDEGKCKCRKGKLESNGQCIAIKCAKDVEPLTNLAGDLVSCTNSSSCTDDGYCLRGFHVCCPKPELKCPAGYTAGAEVTECDPVRNMLGLEETCKDGSYCARLFKSTDQNSGGVCCKKGE